MLSVMMRVCLNGTIIDNQGFPTYVLHHGGDEIERKGLTNFIGDRGWSSEYYKLIAFNVEGLVLNLITIRVIYSRGTYIPTYLPTYNNPGEINSSERQVGKVEPMKF